MGGKLAVLLYRVLLCQVAFQTNSLPFNQGMVIPLDALPVVKKYCQKTMPCVNVWHGKSGDQR